MATSKTDVVNLALGLLDEEPLQGVEQSEKRGRVMAVHLQQAIDQGLSRHPWNCTIRRARLSRELEGGVLGGFVFVLPMDCLLVLRVFLGDGRELGRWEVVAGRRILAGVEEVVLEYSARVEEVAHWSSHVVMVCAYELAAMVARPITGSDRRGAEIRQMLEGVILPDAKYADANEGFSGENNPLRGWVEKSLLSQVRRRR